MMPRVGPIIALLACRVGAYRHQAAEEVVELGGDAHAEGLEAEHDFEVITHDTSNSSGWTVTDSDKEAIRQILAILNPAGADSTWAWQDEPVAWTFGLVKMTAQTARGSLALHLLHRHGLAPLLAARAGRRFGDFFARRPREPGMPVYEFLVESQEQFPEVQELMRRLESLSLGGLRNLHSYDHQWSTTWVDRVDGCDAENSGGCILQAGMSKAAHAFLTRNGFSPRAIETAKGGFWPIMTALEMGYSGLGDDTYGQYLTPQHTGKRFYSGFSLAREGGVNLHLFHIGGKAYIKGDVYWEDGGVSNGVKIQLSRTEVQKYRRAANKKAIVEILFEEHMEKTLRKHKDFMQTHRLKVWSHEQAEFVEMYPKIQFLSN